MTIEGSEAAVETQAAATPTDQQPGEGQEEGQQQQGQTQESQARMRQVSESDLEQLVRRAQFAEAKEAEFKEWQRLQAEQNARHEAAQRDEANFTAMVAHAEEQRDQYVAKVKDQEATPGERAEARKRIREIDRWLAKEGASRDLAPKFAAELQNMAAYLDEALTQKIFGQLGQLLGKDLFDKSIQEMPDAKDLEPHKNDIYELLRELSTSKKPDPSKIVDFARKLTKREREQSTKRMQNNERTAGARYHLEAPDGGSPTAGEASLFKRMEAELDKIAKNPNAQLDDLSRVFVRR